MSSELPDLIHIELIYTSKHCLGHLKIPRFFFSKSFEIVAKRHSRSMDASLWRKKFWKKKSINIETEVLVHFHIDVCVRGKTQTARQVALT